MTGCLRAIVMAMVLWVLLAAPFAQAEGVAVQLKPVAMTAITEKGYQGRTTFTPYIEVEDAAAVERLCARLPRLMESMLVALEERPVQLANVALDIASRQHMFKLMTDGSVGTGVFRAFYLVQGSKTRGEGTEAYFLDGATRECTPIRYLPWTVSVPAAGALVEGAATASQAPALTPSVDPGAPPAREIPPEGAPSPLSEEELARAEAELLADLPEPKPFPGAPPGARRGAPNTVVMALVLLGLAGGMMVVGSYVGYRVAKIRRDRRRRDRRMAKKDRRTGVERRQRADGPPSSGERRSGDDRRKVKDRRQTEDRRTQNDRRAESEAVAHTETGPDTEN